MSQANHSKIMLPVEPSLAATLKSKPAGVTRSCLLPTSYLLPFIFIWFDTFLDTRWVVLLLPVLMPLMLNFGSNGRKIPVPQKLVALDPFLLA